MKGKVIMRYNKSQDEPNPFVHELNFSFLDKVKIAIMSVTVAPIRLIFVILFLLLAWPLAALAVAFRSEEDKLKPISGWRLLLRPIVLFLCRSVFFAGGLYCVKKGKQVTSKDAPILLVAPHSSFLDALPVVFLGLTSVVAKASTQEITLFGTLTEFSQPVLVKREDPNSRINTIKEIQRRGQSGGQWPQIIIFPEGTCTNRSCLISFKQGAFYPGVPVQPVCLRYPNRMDTVTWTWEGPGAFTQLWLTLCQVYTRCEIEFLPVYTPSEAEKADPKLYATNVRAIMSRCLHCPITDHTYDDLREEKATDIQTTISIYSSLAQFDKLHSRLGMDLDSLHQLLHSLRDSKLKQAVTTVRYQQFCDCLQLSKSEVLLQLFQLFDRDGSGVMDMREYILGLSMLIAATSNSGTLKLAFELYDSDSKGYVTQEELRQLLGKTFSISEEQTRQVLREMDGCNLGKITFDEFSNYAQKRREYSRLFSPYRKQHKPLDKFSNGHSAELWSDQPDKKLQ